MISLTLDAQCVIALEDDRQYTQTVYDLIAAYEGGLIDLAIGATIASERQKDGSYLNEFSVFKDRLVKLGIGSIVILPAPLAFDITFWGTSLWISNEESDLIKKIYSILFPASPYELAEYIASHPEIESDKSRANWQNKICDAYALWSHIYHQRDIFVTDDKNFHKKKDILLNCGKTQIESPEAVLKIIN